MDKKPLGQFKWHIVSIYAAVIIIALLGVFTGIFKTSRDGAIPQIVWLGAVVVLLVAVIMVLSNVLRISDAIKTSDKKIEVLSEVLEKTRTELVQISHNTRLSETAKAIASRDADRISLREAVFDKLQAQDFKTAYEIIEEIAHSVLYQELADNLRAEADKYRDASEADRANQVVTHIEELLDNYQWAKASTLIERLIAAAPTHEPAKALRQKLFDKKAERKKMLMKMWDNSVQRQTTDRSLEILRELDQYLTPNEGLALQEAAKDVFRNKLHNFGVQFSLAVSGKQWTRALDTAEHIIADFPNSKMAEEIRGKIEILRKKSQEQGD